MSSGKRNGSLANFDKQAEDMFFQFAKQMTVREGVTETRKAEQEREWGGRMDKIRGRATEIVNNDWINT
ncbi:MAG: TnpV protein [Eubacteriales bacterium]